MRIRKYISVGALLLCWGAAGARAGDLDSIDADADAPPDGTVTCQSSDGQQHYFTAPDPSNSDPAKARANAMNDCWIALATKFDTPAEIKDDLKNGKFDFCVGIVQTEQITNPDYRPCLSLAEESPALMKKMESIPSGQPSPNPPLVATCGSMDGQQTAAVAVDYSSSSTILDAYKGAKKVCQQVLIDQETPAEFKQDNTWIYKSCAALIHAGNTKDHYYPECQEKAQHCAQIISSSTTSDPFYSLCNKYLGSSLLTAPAVNGSTPGSSGSAYSGLGKVKTDHPESIPPGFNTSNSVLANTWLQKTKTPNLSNPSNPPANPPANSPVVSVQSPLLPQAPQAVVPPASSVPPVASGPAPVVGKVPALVEGSAPAAPQTQTAPLDVKTALAQAQQEYRSCTGANASSEVCRQLKKTIGILTSSSGSNPSAKVVYSHCQYKDAYGEQEDPALVKPVDTITTLVTQKSDDCQTPAKICVQNVYCKASTEGGTQGFFFSSQASCVATNGVCPSADACAGDARITESQAPVTPASKP